MFALPLIAGRLPALPLLDFRNISNSNIINPNNQRLKFGAIMNTSILNLETVNGETTAYVASPAERNGKSKAVILIHEWWGLNDNIKNIAGRYADEDFTAIAPDLYRGKLAADPDEAAKLMGDLAIEDGLETIKETMSLASDMFGFSHFGISGYCMGGTYALRAACELEGINAAAPYYGDVPAEDILKNLKVPVVFVSGTKDAWINPAKVAELTDAAEKIRSFCRFARLRG